MGTIDPLAELWRRRRDTFLERVERIDAAIAALIAGTPADEDRHVAEREAHKLAGALGMFGLREGSELALELESALATAGTPDAAAAAQLTETVRRLRVAITAARVADQARDAAPAGPAGVLTDPVETVIDEALVIVVSDDPELTGRLVREAVAVGLAAQATGSVHAAVRLAAGRRESVVLVDLDSAAGDLAPLRGAAPRMATVALASDAGLGARVQATRQDMSLYLDRDAAPADVIAAVDDLIDRQGSQQARAVVVDDDPAIHEVLAALLGPHGVALTAVSDPQRMWECLTEVRPDLLILDLDIPVYSGIDLCRAVRSDPRYADLPVLFLTATRDRGVLEEIFASGADDYVPKPIVGAELLGRVRNRLGRARLMRQLADRDPLTHIANRRKARAEIVRAIAMAQRHRQPLSLAMIDLDHFKMINDDLGHAAGDAVLRALGGLLARSFRQEDIVGRWGGEEFIVCLYGAERADAQASIEELLARLHALPLAAADGTPVQAGFSAGVATFPSDALDFEALYRAADAALYAAKRAGRGRVFTAG